MLSILWASILFLVAAFVPFLTYLVTNAKQRNSLSSKLDFCRHRSSDSFLPSRELSSEKQCQPLDKPPSYLTYEKVFPPDRRAALAELPLKSPGKSANDLSKQPAEYNKLLPDRRRADDDTLFDHVTATGFTQQEIKRLGNFPNYAMLSGIPLPESYEGFDITAALPRPYRPFRWLYHQTMSLTKMEPNWWLELDRNYSEVIKHRESLFEIHGDRVIQTLLGSEIAAKELMEMCLQFLVARYPAYFKLDEKAMLFHNNILRTSTDLESTPPMEVLLHNVPEDFAIMLRDPETGIYSFRGGMIMSSLGWDLGSKIGLKLHEIHAPIPDYKEKMQFSMDRYFAKKPTDKAIQRGSWGLEIDKPLYMPPGDPHELHRERQNPEHTLDQIHLRVDWQTLRRLPLSGAVVFNFKGLFTPISEFRDEPYIPTLLLKILKEGKKNLMEYKSTWHTEHVAVPALEEYEKEQIATGLMDINWQPHTLDESPFFPGWEEKWHRQQGF